MIRRESFMEEHIRELQKTSKRDPVLLERGGYAFGLLGALARVGMPFRFKGGTCLILLMDKPRRLSTDIDIIVDPDTDLDDYLEKASEIFPSISVEEQRRVGKNNIVKRHFKFTYDRRSATAFCLPSRNICPYRSRAPIASWLTN